MRLPVRTPAALRRLFGGDRLPESFVGRLAEHEHTLASALTPGGPVVVTNLGVWLPEGRRVGWHLVSKVTWSDGALSVVEAEETEHAGEAVLLADRPARRLPLTEPGKVPETVHRRVTESIRSRHHRELPGGGAWFVQRKVPGRDGVLLQVRPDAGTEPAAVRAVAARVAAQLHAARAET